MPTKPDSETGWSKETQAVERCADCAHSEGTDADGRCRFMYVASDPSQVVDTSPTNQCSHYCPRTIGERIARKHLPFTDYNGPLSKPGQQLAADIDSALGDERDHCWREVTAKADEWRRQARQPNAKKNTLIQMAHGAAIAANVLREDVAALREALAPKGEKS